MKKLLALVLAMVMTLSLCVTSNAAFSGEEYDYDEAVEVMAAVGVFQGDENGKFNGKTELTREQAAKLIAYLDLGEKVAEALPAVKVFNDVEADRWSAKYIAYCADAGYLAGVGDGNFDPTGKLTGYAFGKMLLCVLGYDAAIENFTGANWTIAVAKLMQSKDIAKSVDLAASATLTREAAAQYCLNALKTAMVEYSDKGTGISVSGVEIKVGAKAATRVESTNKNVADSGYLELGEKLFTSPTLKLDTTKTDAFGRKLNTWTYGKEKVEALSGEADYTFTGTVKGSELLETLGLKSSKKLTFDGKTFKEDAEGTVTKSTKNVFTSENAVVEVNEVLDDGVVDHYTFTVIEYKLGKVTKVVAAKGEDKAYVEVKAVDEELDEIGTAKKFETEGFEKKDIVLYTMVDGEIQSLQLAETVEGKVSAKSGQTATIDGTKYTFKAGFTPVVKAEGTFYLGIDGVVMAAKADETSSDDYAFVYSIVKAKDGTDEDGLEVTGTELTAYYVTAEGETGKAVVYDKDKNIKDTSDTGVYSFVINSDDEFKTVDKVNATTASIDKTTKSVAGKYLSSTTEFVFVSRKDSDGKNKLVVSTATGYKNVDVNSETVYVAFKDNKALTVFVEALEEGLESDLSYAFLLDEDYAESLDADDKTVYEFSVLVDGEEETFVAADADIFSDAGVAENGYFSYKLKDEKLSSVTKVNGTNDKFVDVIDSDIAFENAIVELDEDYVVYDNTDSDDLFADGTLEEGDSVTYYTKTVDGDTFVTVVVITAKKA